MGESNGKALDGETHLPWTGERLVTQLSDSVITIEHLHRYALALEYIRGKIVLDIASGEGYGSNLLGNVAAEVIGVDISKETVDFASKKYERNNLKFRVGSADNIPVPSNSIDVVVSFETLEHHDKHDEMMMEIKRVLKPEGLLIISTPDKLLHSMRDPSNHFHIKEITSDEFKDLIAKYFDSYTMMEQKMVFGSIISPKDTKTNEALEFYNGNFEHINLGLSSFGLNFMNQPFFNVCLASDRDISQINQSFFDGGRVYEAIEIDYKAQIVSLQNRLDVFEKFIIIRGLKRVLRMCRNALKNK